MELKQKSLPIMLFFMLALAGSVMAASTCTFVNPASSGTLTGAEVINISYNDLTITNCSITATSAGSGGSWTVGTAINNSAGNWSNLSTTSVGQYDAGDWSFSATCVNTTGTVATCTATSVVIDNGAPSVASCTIDGSSAASGEIDSSSFTFVCTIKNATSCNVYWDGASTAMTSDTDNTDCSYTGTSSYGASRTSATCVLSGLGDDTESVYMLCSDGTNTTTGTSYSVNLGGYSKAQETAKKNAGVDSFSLLTSGVSKNTKIVAVMALLMMAIIAGSYFLLSGKKR